MPIFLVQAFQKAKAPSNFTQYKYLFTKLAIFQPVGLQPSWFHPFNHLPQGHEFESGYKLKSLAKVKLDLGLGGQVGTIWRPCQCYGDGLSHQKVVLAQTEHSALGQSSYGHAQGKLLRQSSPSLPFEKKTCYVLVILQWHNLLRECQLSPSHLI